MPDLFDNLFNKIGTKINGGRSTHHYGGSSQVNSGSFYSYHSNGTNNKYWLPKSKASDPLAAVAQHEDVNKEDILIKPRMNSVGSSNSIEEGGRSRFNSVVSEKSDI